MLAAHLGATPIRAAASAPTSSSAEDRSALRHHDLTPWHDAARPLPNPHKGWYHHFPDNHPDKYRIASDEDLLAFPGMEHLYIRLAWAYLEPAEGRYDWERIDGLIRKWTAKGLGISFRISCKETSMDRIEQQFATPRWVMEAGAKGGHYRMGQPAGSDAPWEPVWDDPVFLAKLDAFLAAFAARYDGASWLRYVDIGSIGDWGEGHTWAGSRIVCSAATRRTHVDLHLKHFKRTRLVISDDYVHALADVGERKALHAHLMAHGVGYRDDSILVDGYLKNATYRWTVRSPELFADASPHVPTVLELEHYRIVKEKGNWTARPGSNLQKFGGGRSGADYLRGALELLGATYIGYHGDARDWLVDNPELTRELLNRCGYWLFPRTVGLPAMLVSGRSVSLTLEVENRGVAPPYEPYELRLKIAPERGTPHLLVLSGSQRHDWKPGKSTTTRHGWTVPANLPAGRCTIALGLFDVSSGRERPVEFALLERLRDTQGYYSVAEAEVVSP